ncbi:MAG: [FeFe] hydrogenase H-cluster maturation GTPase HydF [Bacteroidales bacterium]|jgi:[FeFe] hydrogenase H-cluster maturation GTPase HydF|nr:[FeFe] hydrogenase H-cluster maturation GTPase HydF [Bacteroidales bacterium]
MNKPKYIGVFGRRNSGKSSIINKLTGEEVAIVSDTPGTTTDPVKKRMEIFGLGPTVLVDTAGIDDEGVLGVKRVEKSRQIIKQIDLALLIYSNNQFEKFEKELAYSFINAGIPFIIIHNQSDIVPMESDIALELTTKFKCDIIEFSCAVLDDKEQKEMVENLISLLVKNLSDSALVKRGMFDYLVNPGDNILLVTPIDSEAPEGRLILPQVNALREILDLGGVATVLQPEQLQSFFSSNKTDVKLVVTDSQAFKMVNEVVPPHIPLTGFSILLAYSKSDFKKYLEGTPVIDKLQSGERVLILESCSHHSSCDDIGRVKIPSLLKMRSGASIEFDVVAGLDQIVKPVTDYALVIQCGGCMVTQRQLRARLKDAIDAGIPVTNYGMALAWCMGIYERAIEPLMTIIKRDQQ